MNAQEQRFLTVMRSLRHQLAGAVDTLDVLLDLAEEQSKPDATADRSRGECPHPMGARMPKATMGHPTRFHCNVCDTDVEA